jgi:hypothetical protein
MTTIPRTEVKVAGRDMRFWLLVILAIGLTAMAGMVVLAVRLAH